MRRSLGWLASIHLAANAVLLWLGYYWLGLGEGRASTLAWSAFVVLVGLGLCCSSYGATLVFFRPETRRGAGAAWRTALRHLAPVAIAVVAVLVIYYFLARWDNYSSRPAAELASWLTLTFRKPVKPSWVLRGFHAALWLVRWAILPVLLLPMLSFIAEYGWSGFRAFGVFARRWLYWIEAPLLLVCALALPLKLLGWVPQVGGFGMESISFVVRAGLAYLLFVTAWLLLAFVTSGGRPRFTQSRTAASP
jgi:hypothetical protein